VKKKKLVIFSGAGMSAESGISTFRDKGGLWEQHRIEDVATPEAWKRNPALVIDFYNQRRKQLLEVSPNAGHYQIAEWEKNFDVHVITQNVDDLHERAGSKNVLHLHGELRKVRSTLDPRLVYQMEGWEMKLGDKCKKGSQLRPHIVWFGEMVPAMEEAKKIIDNADIVVVVGTSLSVYPAAGVIDFAPDSALIFLVDPGKFDLHYLRNFRHIQKTASEGLRELSDLLAGNQSGLS
jgi:NAD-dependent deacetylase